MKPAPDSKPDRSVAPTVVQGLNLSSRWDRPIVSARDRAAAWLHSWFSDHAFLRLIYLNRHRVTDKLWRSAQPTPGQIAGFAREGIRTIVSLRGGRHAGSWPLEVEATHQNGLKLEQFIVRSRGAPDRQSILGAPAFFDSIEYPALIHCKSGADRAGFVAALYLILRQGATADEALKQLSFRYGHFHWAKTGILDAFFERYRDEGEARGIPFLEWVEKHYDPVALERDFKPHFWSMLINDYILRRE